MKKTFFTIFLLGILSVFTRASTHDILVSFIIQKGEESTRLPQVTAKSGKPFTISDITEFITPTRFDPPSILIKNKEQKEIIPLSPDDFTEERSLTLRQEKKDNSSIIPSTPQDFIAIEKGLRINAVATKGAEVINLSGKISYTEVTLENLDYGELSGPIRDTDKNKTLLTENKTQMPSVITTDTYFNLFAKPGKKYKIKIRMLDRWVPCTVQCDYAK